MALGPPPNSRPSATGWSRGPPVGCRAAGRSRVSRGGNHVRRTRIGHHTPGRSAAEGEPGPSHSEPPGSRLRPPPLQRPRPHGPRRAARVPTAGKRAGRTRDVTRGSRPSATCLQTTSIALRSPAGPRCECERTGISPIALRSSVGPGIECHGAGISPIALGSPAGPGIECHGAGISPTALGSPVGLGCRGLVAEDCAARTRSSAPPARQTPAAAAHWPADLGWDRSGNRDGIAPDPRVGLNHPRLRRAGGRVAASCREAEACRGGHRGGRRRRPSVR
jgi:hypothetical protein